MKTTYWLVSAAAVAAAGVFAYARLSANAPPLPKVPLVAESPPREVPHLALPPVVVPPDEPLALPVVPTGPVAPASGSEPLIPPLPAPPKVPGPVVSEPLEPLVPPVAKPTLPMPAETFPLIPFAPEKTAPPPVKPAPLPPAPPTPAAPPVLQPPVVPTPVKPDPAPPVAAGPREPLSVAGKYVVLKDDKLIEGSVAVNGDMVLVRQGALDRPFPKSQVQFVAASRDEVYRFMLAKVSANDALARLKVARWCMFSGMREQALTEAQEVLKIQPSNTAAADLVRSLERSLQEFPPENLAKMTLPTAPTFPPEPTPARPIPPAILDSEPDVSPEAALVFGARVQPFLANQCMECHAKPDHAGKFKLVRVNPAEAGPQATRTNLRAVAGQLRKDDPAASPLLLKSLTAHGGMKLPAVVSRQAAAYLALEGWTALAVGTPVAAQPAPPVVPPALPAPLPPVAPPVLLPPPASDPLPPLTPPTGLPLPLPVPQPQPQPLPLPVPPPAVDPLLPILPMPGAPAPLPKPVPVPAIPPADPLIPILPPAVPPLPNPVPVAPPFIPPADTGMKPVPVPAIPPIPPATAATKLPSPVVPVSGTQFGSSVPPKPPVTGPTGGDEFDPAGFNQPRK